MSLRDHEVVVAIYEQEKPKIFFCVILGEAKTIQKAKKITKKQKISNLTIIFQKKFRF